MRIKVFECFVKANLEDDYAKAVAYFKKHNLDIVFEREQTLVKLPEWQVRQTLVVPNDGKYDVVMYVYDRPTQRPNGTGLAENFSQKTSSVFIPTGIPEDPSEGNYLIIVHEIMHCLFNKVRNAGVQVQDVMDTYLQNNFPDHPDGNFARSFRMLQPYWNIISPAPPIENYFKIQEFVSNAIYQQYGEKSIWFIDPRIQKLANFTRKFFNKSVTINNWLWGGSYDQRGFRDTELSIGAKLSQHRCKAAIDINVAGMTPKAVFEAIMANEKVFMAAGLTCLEDIADTPAHVHMDIRQTGLDHILIVKP